VSVANIPHWLKFGTPRYLRRDGVLYKLPRGYRKRLNREYCSWQIGMVWKVILEAHYDGLFEPHDDLWP
jgi:hypothetical protein